MKRNCDNCKKEYEADERNLKRGWGLTCSKSCAASKREKSKKGYNHERVRRNNALRVVISDMKSDYKKEVNRKKEKPLDWEYGLQIDSFNDPI